MTRPATGGKHTATAGCDDRRLAYASACQLCSVHGGARDRVRMMQPAVATIAGIRVCAGHERLIRAIVADAGVRRRG